MKNTMNPAIIVQNVSTDTMNASLFSSKDASVEFDNVSISFVLKLALMTLVVK